ncbi:MAG: GNAT family N-acetyltransferase, partial [Flavobacteriaceae bacterium]
QNNFHIVDDVPGYLDAQIHKMPGRLKLKKVDTYEGSFINISKYGNITDYLNAEISSQRRSTIKRCAKRLDLCLRPKYQMYYGEMAKSDYDRVFDHCIKMLLRRHEQKKTYWAELEYWQERYDNLYELVQQKKACIYVIYHEEQPISIYVNSVHQDILDIDVIAYDIDYSKFKLGFITLVKVIRWAMENNFNLIDMSKGDFFYKERFRTGTYTFQRHIIYNPKKLLFSIKAILSLQKSRLLYYMLSVLKKWKINKLYQAYIRARKKNLFEKINVEHHTFEVEKDVELPADSMLELVNIKNPKYSFIKKEFLDFLFLSFGNANEVEVYKVKPLEKTFYFKAEKTTQKLTYN